MNKYFYFTVTKTGHPNYFEIPSPVKAMSKTEAESDLEKFYPPHDGYVIHYLTSTKHLKRQPVVSA